ncbi:cyclic nucleotide-gated channel cone photoreceptor subunit alpha-like [Gigantopelta aegis]|uniref:cyclic nucleotide-gated channel cone photoreceptor subunit alpha-like n=1 Tax=Gigantopelta aegis TaxID=1735272 RepID=UPI001B88796E|nr:cyclic nucleotide-gated channel cone photoreceptor subunit alpha-like [Gigantopelta aegis]
MSGVLGRRNASDTGVAVKYTPCAKAENTDDDDIDEIAIVNDDDQQLQQPQQQTTTTTCAVSSSAAEGDVGHLVEPVVTANGPRHLPGLEIYQSPSDRTKLIGERLSSSDKISLSSPIYSNKVVEQISKSSSKHSLLDLVSSKLDIVKSRKRYSLANQSLMKKHRPSEANITSKGLRKQRRKELEEKFGKKSIRGDRNETLTTVTESSEHDGCNWTFVFDPSGRLCYWWSSFVSLAFLYNFWVIIYRFAFQEISRDNIATWFTLDYLADLVYVMDVAFHFRTGYLQDGVLQTDGTKLRIHYMNSTTFYIDCLCLLPLDFMYLSIGFCSMLRCFRLVKVYRFWSFQDRTERHTNYPNLVRTMTLFHYLLALFHWNACLYYIVATRMERSPDIWRFPKDEDRVVIQYLHALYWSTLTLTTLGNPPRPKTVGEYLFVLFEMVFALMLFATVLGHVANIVTNISAARKEFQARLDTVKTYMGLRRVPLKLQDRVIKWFDYLWMCNKSADEEKDLGLLPDKLKAEIAIHVHLDTLKRVEVFQATEAGFLCELVLRLRPVLFSPGDYICRKGEVGKEMYIVNRGKLQVVADNGKTVLATLKPGSYFGEISILNMGTAGNRRTASVRSVGYSDLFCLSKKDLWEVLKEYPAARVKLEAIAVKRLEKYKKAPLEKVALARSRSTPGLVESAGKVPLDHMLVSRHHTLPASLISSGTDGRADERKANASQSEDNLVAHAPCHEEPEPAQQVVCNMTTSMTISSLTSCMSGSPPIRSPVCTELQKNTFSPPLSPRQVTCSPIGGISTISASALPVMSNSFQQPISQLQPNYNPMIQQYPYAMGPHPMTYLSPFCASPGIMQQTPSSALLIAPQQANLGASQSNLVPPHIQHPSGAIIQSSMPSSPLAASAGSPISFGSPSRDSQSDILLKEISRLRERLAQVETENTALTVKLNQQQWDVENRLTELELHICQSDSVTSTGSGDERTEKPSVNRESII